MIEALSGFFGMIIRFIYQLVGNNYLVSILLFTIFTKLILFPLNLGQAKSTEELKKIAPEDQKIREKYKNNKEKQSEELMKLYGEHKINPIGGCLPMLIQFPIILAMLWIVRMPLTYITQTPAEEIKTYTQEVLNKEEVSAAEIKDNELIVAKEKGLINLNAGLNFNLGDVPSNVFSKNEAKKAHPVSLLIPILTFIFAVIQNKVMQKTSAMTDEQKEMQKSMNIMMPLLSTSIAYTMPIALGIYWLFGNILQIIQQYIIMWMMERKEKKLTLKEG